MRREPPTGSANALVHQACVAQGIERWRSLSRVNVHLRVRPTLLLGRFRPAGIRTMTASIDTTRVRTVLSPFPAPGYRGLFLGDEVRIESDSGAVTARLTNARSEARRRLVWSDLHTLYFLGYAFWNYVQTPFMFLRPGFELAELPPTRIAGVHLRRLRARFPADVPTHSREQLFYFDESGLLRRLDYTAEIFSRWARGAHVVEGHRDFDGLVYPTHRRVTPRLWFERPLPWPSAIEGWIDGVDTIEAPS